MHRYGVQPLERGWSWTSVLTVAYLVLSFASQYLSDALSFLPYSEFLRTPIVATLAAAGSYHLFNRRGWRWPIIRSFIGIPDLNGTWKLVISPDSPDPKGAKQFPVQLTINQTFSRISITTKTDISTAASYAASIEILATNQFRLSNLYSVDPIKNTLKPHKGVNRIIFDVEAGLVKPSHGDYFTDADRKTHGHFVWPQATE